MSVTPEIEEEVLRIYRANPKRFSPFKTARQTGIQMSEVIAITMQYRDSRPEETVNYNGEGREDLRPFIVARRRATVACWDNTEPGVKKAREDFMAGTHTMATHRDGGWLLLCSIPLVFPETPNPDYFTLGVS